LTLPLLVVVLGPTASGKTALAVRLAEHFDGEIVSCDSVTVYREFEIGTAKPMAQERQRVPHHLLDVVSPLEAFTAGDYARLARLAISGIRSRGHLPLIAGGAGLYLRALIEGLFAGPARSEDLRQRLRVRAADRGPLHLHRILARLDPQAAKAIHPNDVSKLVRALEVCLTASHSLSTLWQQGRDPLAGFRILRLGLAPDREALYQRINTRARQMFSQGLIEETRYLLQRYPAARTLESLGYKQSVQHLRGEITLDQAIALTGQGHRNFAKRQMTWFRREPDVQWMSGFGDEAQVQQQCLEKVAAAL
jgi:tRNA dimethylallyltransferase